MKMHGTSFRQKMLSHNYDKATVYVTLHDTVSSNKGLKVGIREKDCRQEKMDTKII